jgi:LysM repeat protein
MNNAHRAHHDVALHAQHEFWLDQPRRRPVVDPFVVRVAMMLVIGLIVTLVVFAAKRGGTDVLHTAPTGGAIAVPMALVAEQPAAVVAAAAAPAAAMSEPAAVQPAVVARAAAHAGASPAVTRPATRSCSRSYSVVAGDYWILIAQKAHVTTKQLLAANGATAKTKLYPGRTVCLPKNATVPKVAPTTTAAPKPAAPKPAAPKPAAATPAPATTAAPTTTIARRSYTAAEVEAIIREVWPDDLEDEALRIAQRESNLRPTAKNSCCYGLFQINYTPHKKWLAAIGVTSADQLLDPAVNANAALTLYTRAGGFGPWAL